jgi:hypothetical protein
MIRGGIGESGPGEANSVCACNAGAPARKKKATNNAQYHRDEGRAHVKTAWCSRAKIIRNSPLSFGLNIPPPLKQQNGSRPLAEMLFI